MAKAVKMSYVWGDDYLAFVVCVCIYGIHICIDI